MTKITIRPSQATSLLPRSPIMRGFQFSPIKGDTGAGFVRRNGEMVLDHQWSGGVFIDGKAVNLEPSRVRLSGDQAHMQLLHAVTANRNTMLAR